MTCEIDRWDSIGAVAVASATGPITIGWIREKSEGGFSAWVCWDDVTYLAARESPTREDALAAILRWVEIVTSPNLADKLALVLSGPWVTTTSGA
jgi:hypothetical protein